MGLIKQKNPTCATGALSLSRVLIPRPQLGEADECSFLERAEQVRGPAYLVTGHRWATESLVTFTDSL